MCDVNTNQFETSEENLLHVLPYYNTPILPEFGRSLSTHSSCTENEQVFNMIRPHFAQPDYSNEDIEHQLGSASSNKLHEDDEDNLQFENEAQVEELMEGALDFTTRLSDENINKGCENGRGDIGSFYNNEQNNIGDTMCVEKESLPTYLNADVEKKPASENAR